MKKAINRKTGIFLFLTLMLLSVLTPIEAHAKTESSLILQTSFYGQMEQNLKEELSFTKSISFASRSDSYTCDTVKVASEELRLAMRHRQEEITFQLPFMDDEEEMQSVYRSIYKEAIRHTGNGTEGDSLAWQIDKISCEIASSYENQNTIYQFHITYYTNQAMEEELERQIASLKKVLPITDEQDDYTKVLTLYDYVAHHVSYEHQITDSIVYSAYGAMVQKKAVCQGYSNLLYRLLLEYGIENRIIVSDNHAWNLVCVDGLYYECDVTWDSQYTKDGQPYQYFLKANLNQAGDTVHVWSKEELAEEIFSLPRGKENYLYYKKKDNEETKRYSLPEVVMVSVTSSTLYAEYQKNDLYLRGYYSKEPLILLWNTEHINSLETLLFGLFTPLEEGVDYQKQFTVKGKNTYLTLTGIGNYEGQIVLSFPNQFSAPKCNIKSTKNAVTLSWGKVENASSYKVYRKKGKRKWELVATTTKNQWKDKRYKGTVSYRVCSCYQKQKSGYSNKVTVKN